MDGSKLQNISIFVFVEILILILFVFCITQAPEAIVGMKFDFDLFFFFSCTIINLTVFIAIDRSYSQKTDAWAYGVVIFEVLTCCEEPYEGLAAIQVATRVANG